MTKDKFMNCHRQTEANCQTVFLCMARGCCCTGSRLGTNFVCLLIGLFVQLTENEICHFGNLHMLGFILLVILASPLRARSDVLPEFLQTNNSTLSRLGK